MVTTSAYPSAVLVVIHNVHEVARPSVVWEGLSNLVRRQAEALRNPLNMDKTVGPGDEGPIGLQRPQEGKLQRAGGARARVSPEGQWMPGLSDR